MEEGCASIVAPDLDRLPATSMANLPTWPLEFFCEMLHRNVAQKCCRGEMLPHIFLAGGSQDGISTLTAEKKK